MDGVGAPEAEMREGGAEPEGGAEREGGPEREGVSRSTP